MQSGLKKSHLAVREDLSIVWRCVQYVRLTVALLFLNLCALKHLLFCLCSWLLQDSSMRLRTTHPAFTQAVNTFFDKLIPKVVPLQVPVYLENMFFIAKVLLHMFIKMLVCVCVYVLVQERRSHHCSAGGKWVWILCKGSKLHAVY